MTGMEIAWRTLNMERVTEPCILAGWIMNGEFFSHVTGRDFWSDREAVACEAFRRLGANLCPQLALPAAPGEGKCCRHEEVKKQMEETRARWRSPERVRDFIETLPDPERASQDFNFEQARDSYAAAIMRRRDGTGEDVLWIDEFGQADFMGGYTRWGYENYLGAIGLYPEHMKRYYDYTGELGRLKNEAIVAAVRENDLAPFVYGGQDICFNDGPICSPAVLREIYFPALRRAVEPLIEGDVRIIWHCDGNVLPILDDLIDIGVSGFQGFQEECGVELETMTRLKTRWGRKPIIWGSVSVTTTLPFGTAEDVRRDVERCFDIASPGGGFGLAMTSSCLPETPIENLLALFEHASEYGREALSRT